MPVHVHDGEQETELHSNETDAIDRVTEAVHDVGGARPPHKTTRCYLLEIPPELRLRIYGYVFEDNYEPDFVIWPCGKMRRDLNKGPPAHFSALLKTCSLVAQETAPVLYHDRIFIIHIVDNDPAYTSHQHNYGDLRPVNECSWFEYLQSLKIYIDSGSSTISSVTQNVRLVLAKQPKNQKATYLHLDIQKLGEGEGDPLYKALMRMSFSSDAFITHWLGRSKKIVSKEVLDRFQQGSADALHLFL
ncbi:hypothetical protein LTR10_011380 [Elasticomyces elasticus]|nr:hypothetical protein LTR10_011380 [Elasticomyces elasticus]